MYHNQSIQIMYKPTFLERDDFGDRKRHQLPKSICFLNCVFLPCYFYTILPYLAMGSPGQLPTLPNGFPFVETRLTKEKKLVKPLQGRVSCYPVGCVTSLVTIITNGRSRRDLPLAPRTPSHFPKNLCLQTRRDHATVWRQRARATRHLVTETAPAPVC